MRNKLRKLGSKERHTFIGIFSRVGYKQDYEYYKPTLVLTNVILAETGEVVTDHLWFNYTRGFQQLGELLKGDKIQFDGRMAMYQKGYYFNRQADAKIERPTKVKLLEKVAGERHSLPDTATKEGKQALIGYIMERERSFYEANCRPIEDYFVETYKNWKINNH